MSKSYEELIFYDTFEDRFNYLMLKGNIGEDTFGYARYLNQVFYRSAEWRHVRSYVIARDNGNDLGVDGFPVIRNILIHHINPVTIEDIKNRSPKLLDPNNLITVSKETHNAIHYGTELKKVTEPNKREPFDTVPWRCLWAIRIVF